MPRFKLVVEYAGGRYSGWQIQKNARTVQGEIERAVREVTGRREFELYGAGRTDAGVHALAQVAHLELYTDLPPETLRARINDALPHDIYLRTIDRVPHRFHARHDAVSRQLPVSDRTAQERVLQALRVVDQGAAGRRRGCASRRPRSSA